MTEAWNAEQRKAAGIAPDLINPHEPDERCGDLHCYIHGVDEPAEGAYKTCGECGHVYRTAEALREAWAFNFGRSVEVGAREISRIADERAGAGVSGAPVRTGRRQGGGS